MPLTSKRDTRSAGEKLNIHVAGTVFGYEVVTDLVFDHDQYDCKTARLMTVFHSIQKDLVVLLYWEHDNGEHELIMPIEGRGILAFDRFDGMQNPKADGLTGRLLMRVYQHAAVEPDSSLRYFALSFELFKQRN